MTLQADNFKVTALRLVAFTPIHADFNQSATLAAVLGKFAKRFDGEVQAIPLPGEVPPDFPRIQLASTDGRWMFAAAPSRVTSSWNLKNVKETTRLDDVVASSMEPLKHHISANGAQVGRIAIVIKRACQVENSAETLIDRFCRDEVKNPDSSQTPLRNSKNFEIHNYKRYGLQAELTINSWVRCRSETMGTDAISVVTVEQDMNTLAEEIETRRFNAEEIDVFFDKCVSEADEILEKYFPKGR